jgi:AcrR family transcriptional regulator
MSLNNTRSLIMETARKLFNEKGTRVITTNHIAKDLGISPGTLYYHFKNKEEIIHALYDLKVEETRKVWAKNNRPDFKKFLKILNTINFLLWEYSFFQREHPALIQNDQVLKKKSMAVKKQWWNQVESFVQELINAKILINLEDEKTKSLLIKLHFLIAEYWLVYLDVEGKPINQKNVLEGIEMVLLIFRPYLSKKALREITEELEEG